MSVNVKLKKKLKSSEYDLLLENWQSDPVVNVTVVASA
jgi:hypothetical protein